MKIKCVCVLRGESRAERKIVQKLRFFFFLGNTMSHDNTVNTINKMQTCLLKNFVVTAQAPTPGPSGQESLGKKEEKGVQPCEPLPPHKGQNPPNRKRGFRAQETSQRISISLQGSNSEMVFFLTQSGLFWGGGKWECFDPKPSFPDLGDFDLCKGWSGLQGWTPFSSFFFPQRSQAMEVRKGSLNPYVF